jgi:hypothetical protein
VVENNGGNRIKLSLSPQAERYARRDAPIEARLMAARGALPLEPIEIATVLFVLMHDGETEVKDTARASLEQLPDAVLDPVLSGPAHPALLSLLARIHKDDESRCAKLALNAACDDATIAFLATLPLRQVVDIVSQNQSRMMRCDDIVESLGANPLTGRAVIERILGFLGTAPGPDERARPEDVSDEDAAAAVAALLGNDLADLARELTRETEQPVADEPQVGSSLFAALQKMTVMQKVKLARLGGNEARGLLIRDRNKVVASAAIHSPKITDAEVVGYAQSRGLCDEVYRVISSNREWTRNYQVKLALATNPKVPMSQAVGLLNYLQDKDLKSIMKSRDVPSAISTQARRLLQKKGKI